MKKNWVNQVHLEGWIFSHSLENRISKKGVPYIGGELQIATDAEAMNVVKANFMYVTETFNSGASNQTYNVLQEIIDNADYTYEKVGTDARKVRIDGNVEVNDFYDRNGDLASFKRFSGRFVHFMNAGDALNDRPATFNMEMIINKVKEREVDNGENYVELSGYGFDFRKALLPVTYTVRGKAGMDYFLGADISDKNPMVTEVWGDIVSSTIKKEKEIESAFGASTVEVTTQTVRAWDVVGCSKVPMDWDDEAVITKDELVKCVKEREVYLAEIKKRHDEYISSRGNSKSNNSAFKSTSAGAGSENSDDFVF